MDPIWFGHWRFISPLETFAGSQKYVTAPIIPIRNESVRSFYTSVSKLNLYIAKPWKQAFVGLCEFFDTRRARYACYPRIRDPSGQPHDPQEEKIPLSIFVICYCSPCCCWPTGLHLKALARPCPFATATIFGLYFPGRATFICYLYLFCSDFMYPCSVPHCGTRFLVLTIGTPLSPIWVPPIAWSYMDQR